MAGVVSDTTPLHYLILVGSEWVLERLYGKVFVPPAVLSELSHSSAPAQIWSWAVHPPSWLIIATPDAIPPGFEALDLGERQALALARQINADLVLLDDKVARRLAVAERMKVKGTLGVVADAAKAKLLNFAETVGRLQHTTMHLHREVLDEVIREFERSNQVKQS